MTNTTQSGGANYGNQGDIGKTSFYDYLSSFSTLLSSDIWILILAVGLYISLYFLTRAKDDDAKRLKKCQVKFFNLEFGLSPSFVIHIFSIFITLSFISTLKEIVSMFTQNTNLFSDLKFNMLTFKILIGILFIFCVFALLKAQEGVYHISAVLVSLIFCFMIEVISFSNVQLIISFFLLVLLFFAAKCMLHYYFGSDNLEKLLAKSSSKSNFNIFCVFSAGFFVLAAKFILIIQLHKVEDSSSFLTYSSMFIFTWILMSVVALIESNFAKIGYNDIQQKKDSEVPFVHSNWVQSIVHSLIPAFIMFLTFSISHYFGFYIWLKISLSLVCWALLSLFYNYGSLIKARMTGMPYHGFRFAVTDVYSYGEGYFVGAKGQTIISTFIGIFSAIVTMGFQYALKSVKGSSENFSLEVFFDDSALLIGLFAFLITNIFLSSFICYIYGLERRYLLSLFTQDAGKDEIIIEKHVPEIFN